MSQDSVSTQVEAIAVHNSLALPELHRLIKQRLFSPAIERVLNPENKHEAGTVDPKTGNLPISIALRISSCPLLLIQILLETYWYEEVIDTLKRLNQDPPLVVAVREGRSIEIIEYLIEVSSLKGLRKDRNKYGQLPLHFAAKASLEVTQTLIDADSRLASDTTGNSLEAARQPDIFGALPLHCFIKKQSKLASIEMLLQAYPDAVLHADKEGMLPLHYVMKHNASLVTLQCLLAANPDAARITDVNGNLPIFCAFQEGSHTANLAPKIDILLRVYPEAILHKNAKGETLFTVAQKIKKSGLLSSWWFNSERLIDNILHRTVEEWIVLRKEKLRTFKKHLRDHCESDYIKMKRPRPLTPFKLRDEPVKSEDEVTDERTLILTAFSRVIQKAMERNTKKAQRAKSKCYVCWENPSSFAMVPCGHIALCADCANIENIIMELGGNCPVEKCSYRIFRAQKVILSLGHINESDDEQHILNLFNNPCVICLEDLRSQILVPCGHMALCSDCASTNTLRRLKMKCPLGRCAIVGTMEIKTNI